MTRDNQPLGQPNDINQPIDEFEQLVDEVSTYSFSEKLTSKDKQTIQSYALRLLDVSMASTGENLDPVPTDRNSRKNLRLLAKPTFDIIDQETEGDKELELQLKHGIIASMGRAGVVPASVRVFEALTETSSQPKPEQKSVSVDDYTPKVKPADKEFLDNLVSAVETSGKWSPTTTKNTALGFLDIYYPAMMQAEKNHGSRQQVLDAIATTNTYRHAVASALSQLPEIQQSSSIDEVKAEIVKLLKQRATPAKLKQLEQFDDYTINDVEEIKQFSNAMKGARYEILAHNALESLELDNYKFSSIKEDITNGYDLVLEKNERRYYLDVKAARSFIKSANKYRPETIQTEAIDRGYLIRKSRHTDQDGNDISIIVLDVETTGSIKYQRNRLQLTNPENYQATILEAMGLVDNTLN